MHGNEIFLDALVTKIFFLLNNLTKSVVFYNIVSNYFLKE